MWGPSLGQPSATWLRTHSLRAYSVGAYGLGEPIWDLATHLMTGGLQCVGLAWKATMWGPTVSGTWFRTSSNTHWLGFYNVRAYGLGAYRDPGKHSLTGDL